MNTIDGVYTVRPPHRLSRLLWVLLALCLGLALPSLAEKTQFAITRGQLRAKSESAAAELSRLDKTAELVRVSDTSRAFRLVAQRIEPSVVHIDTRQTAAGLGAVASDEYDYFEEPGRNGYISEGQGSGVIVDEAGYVLTNYHVVKNADEIQVKLSDGRTVNRVEVIGYDLLTDLAVLRLRESNLVAAAWGDSQALQVGDWVLAVGNPYGLDRTVTSGIVSATRRRGLAQFSVYQDFLQTDAAVNPGNSGGPLVNIQGELVGITTAIVGRAFQGISFAIPSEVARNVYERLKESGNVARGWLGVAPKNLTPELAKRLGLSDTAGALVVHIIPGSPAEAAGIQKGDVIVQWNDSKVTEASELPLLVAGTKIGSKAKVQVIREGQRLILEAPIGERPSESTLRPQ